MCPYTNTNEFTVDSHKVQISSFGSATCFCRFSSQFTKKGQTFRHPATAHFLCFSFQRNWGTLSLCFFTEKDKKHWLEAVLGCQWKAGAFRIFSLNEASSTFFVASQPRKLVESKIMYIISIKYLFFAPIRNRLVCWPKMPKPPKIVFVAYELWVNFRYTTTAHKTRTKDFSKLRRNLWESQRAFAALIQIHKPHAEKYL